MLFLGLGTGLGTTLIVDGVVAPMELAHLPYRHGRTYEEYVGKAGFERMGKRKWRQVVADVTERLGAALEVDYVVLGGGNAKFLDTLPPGSRLGNNGHAFAGGYRLWTDAQEQQGGRPARRSGSPTTAVRQRRSLRLPIRSGHQTTSA